ncbi:MAG TPA: hypothetical protein VNE62_03005 [Actinomycetota bacterium]|nr:hypothetical protein [Actinomycetota bacterium]
MILKEFYSAVSGLSFTLLGLWWAVATLRREEWGADRSRRRMARQIALSFLLPGVMSLVSLLAVRVTVVWNVGFGLAGALGAVSTAALLAGDTERSPGGGAGRLVLLAMVVLYSLIAVVAVFPKSVAMVGVGLRPLEVEGILVSIFVFLGVNLAWLFLFDPLPELPGPESRRRRS